MKTYKTGERIDHAADAVRHIAWAHEQQEQEGDMGNVPRDYALLAQVHATLALAEQQRVTNLIALLSNAARMVAENTASSTEYASLFEKIDPAVREGLGL